MGEDINGGLQQVVTKILVIHPNLGAIAGGEMVLLKVLEMLVERKYDVSLLGELCSGSIFDDLPLSSVKQTSCKFELDYELNFKPKRLRVYRELFHNSKLRAMFRRKFVGKFELEINTSGTMLYSLGMGKKCVEYVQNFPHIVDRMQQSGLRYRWLRRLYYCPSTFQLKRQVKKVGLVLCNSCFTQKAVLDYWGREAVVVYPPVDVESFKPCEKELFVVSVGRFAPEKNFELIVEVAKCMPDVKFVIAGRKQFDFYFDKIAALKPDNLDLITDISRDDLSVLLGRAKVYLHSRLEEPFGISVGEAMAAGCVPVVHDSGGPVEVVGGFGFVYADVGGCVGAVRAALESGVDPKVFVERARLFSSDSFKKNFIATLEKNGFL